MSHSGPYDSSKPYSSKELLKYVIEDLKPSKSGVNVDTSPKQKQNSETLTTDGSWDYMDLGGSVDWDIRSISYRLENTSSSESIQYRLVGTIEDSPEDPSTSLNDWFSIVDPTTLNSGKNFDGWEQTNAQRVALGVTDGSGSASVNRELSVASDGTNVDLLKRIGDDDRTGSSSYETDPTASADLLQAEKGVVKRLKDHLGEDTQSQNEDPTAQSSLIEAQKGVLKRIKDDIGEEDQTSNPDPTVTSSLIQAQKGVLERLRDDLGEEGDSIVGAGSSGSLSSKLRRVTDTLGTTGDGAAGYNNTGSLTAQSREIVKTLGDDQNASPSGHTTAGTVLSELLQIDEDIGDETNPDEAGFGNAGDLQEQLLQIQTAIGNDDSAQSSEIVEDPASSAKLLQLVKGQLAIERGALEGKDQDDEYRSRIHDSSGSQINPATEGTLSNVDTNTSNIDSDIGDSGNVNTQSSPGTDDNLLNYTSGLLQALQNTVAQETTLSNIDGDLGTASDDATYDSSGSVIGHLRQIQAAFGNDGGGSVEVDPSTNTTHLNYLRGILSLFSPESGDGPARAAAKETFIESDTAPTQDSFTTISSGGTPAQFAVSRQTLITIVVENLSSGSSIPADFQVQGRINSLNAGASSWVEVDRAIDVSYGSSARLKVEDAGMTEYRVRAKDDDGSNTTEVKAFILVRGN